MHFRPVVPAYSSSNGKFVAFIPQFCHILGLFSLFFILFACVSCASTGIAKNEAESDMEYVGDSADAPPSKNLPYYRLLRDNAPDGRVQVTDIFEIRRNSLGDLDPIGPTESGPNQRVVVPQSKAWWLHAPQFKQPRLVRSGMSEQKIKVPSHLRGKETIVRVHLDEDGSVAQLKVLRGVDKRLDNLCRDMIGQSTFEPARWKGIPLRFTFLIPCRWHDADNE